jgi:hypothetical protein
MSHEKILLNLSKILPILILNINPLSIFRFGNNEGVVSAILLIFNALRSTITHMRQRRSTQYVSAYNA